MQCFSTPTRTHANRPPSRLTRLLSIALSAIVFLATSATPVHAWVDPTTAASSATRVTRPAEIPLRNWQPGHRGVDLAAEPGDTVYASGNGIVHFAGTVAGTPVVSLQHPEGFRTTYQPVRTALKKGAVVAEGDALGTLVYTSPGAPHRHDGLHWGALKAGPGGEKSYFDPLTLLDVPEIRLKPIGPQ